MVCRFNPFYIGPTPPSCCTDLKPECDCPTCSPDTGYQEPRPVNEECGKVTKKEAKESKCVPPCKEAPKKEKKDKSEKKDAKKTKKNQ